MSSRRNQKTPFRIAVVAIVGLLMTLMTVTAFAALLTTTAGNLSVFKPTKLPGCRFPGDTTVIAAEDSYVDQDAPTDEFGSNANLYVMSRAKSTLDLFGDPRNRRTYVKYTLPTLPEACVVRAATLRLFAKSAASGRTIQAFRATGTWAEATVNWGNQPGGTGTAVTSASGTGWRTWSVLDHVQQMYTGPNNGFMLRDLTEGDGSSGHAQNYSSSEDTLNHPELVITIGNPP